MFTMAFSGVNMMVPNKGGIDMGICESVMNFLSGSVKEFMTEVQFEKYCKDVHDYIFTGNDDGNCENRESITPPDKDGNKLCRCKHHFRYEKGDNTVHVFYYEYCSFKRGEGGCVLGYSVISVKENNSTKIK